MPHKYSVSFGMRQQHLQVLTSTGSLCLPVFFADFYIGSKHEGMSFSHALNVL